MKYIDPDNKNPLDTSQMLEELKGSYSNSKKYEKTFEDLGLSDKTIEILKKRGYEKPTVIQARAIPLLLEGKKDIVGQSQTGTGKTASFALPILERIKGHSKTVQAIILTPTRELALQVSKEIDSLKTNQGIRVLAVYGGAPIGAQISKLKSGVDIIVGTPGRIMDLQRRKYLKLDNIKYAVLDEADEMLNMGFVEDIETILENSPIDKTMLLFSATMPRQIMNIAKKYMREYELIEVDTSQATIDTVEQIYYELNNQDKFEALRRIFDYYPNFHGIVFCNTKATVDSLAQQLNRMGYKTSALHGDVTQSQREKILQQFKNKYITILVATDVAARGIDVNDLTHVINYSFPQSPEAYVHRIGRTGRAGKQGISATFVVPAERKKLVFIERVNKCRINKRTLPSANQIIANKEVKIRTLIKDSIVENDGKLSKYSSLADELLQEHSPNDVIAAILKHSFKNDLEIDSYKAISDVSNIDNPRHGQKNKKSRKKSGKGRNKKKYSGGKSSCSRSGGGSCSSKKSSKKSKGNKKSGARHY